MINVKIDMVRYKNGCALKESAPNAEKQSPVLRLGNHAVHPTHNRMLACMGI